MRGQRRSAGQCDTGHEPGELHEVASVQRQRRRRRPVDDRAEGRRLGAQHRRVGFNGNRGVDTGEVECFVDANSVAALQPQIGARDDTKSRQLKADAPHSGREPGDCVDARRVGDGGARCSRRRARGRDRHARKHEPAFVVNLAGQHRSWSLSGRAAGVAEAGEEARCDAAGHQSEPHGSRP